ncbi:MAG: hypothetical protein O6947_04645 [Acidobacteria bacterium]|nr:hypothetical protein [Acidobacteriota bacterium]
MTRFGTKQMVAALLLAGACLSGAGNRLLHHHLITSPASGQFLLSPRASEINYPRIETDPHDRHPVGFLFGGEKCLSCLLSRSRVATLSLSIRFHHAFDPGEHLLPGQACLLLKSWNTTSGIRAPPWS